MDFKAIKHVDDLPDGYEMDKECTFVRKGSIEYRIETDKLELDTTKGTKKRFGVRTLYWSSWGCAPARFPSKKGATKPAAPIVAKQLSNSLGFGNKQLLSNYLRGHLLNLIEKRENKGYLATGQEIDDGKSFSARVLIHNAEKKLLLIRIYSQNWRDGLWFYDPETGKYVAFKKEIHKPGHGDISIIWPEVA